ncbi:MAG: CoA transferase [Candidatus Tectomicrobia bacterium]|nr:CoA transferase [Candidatus Tectomicrobia bacterium]
MNKPPLDGIRIIDLTGAWAGSYMTCILADMGAEVIKVESFSHLDSWRGVPDRETAEKLNPKTYIGGQPGSRPYDRSVIYQSINRNKRSIALNLKAPEGVEIFRRLVKIGDVVAENFSPRVMKGFGLDYPALKEINPRIVMISISAYGHTGPYGKYRGIGGTTEPMDGMASLIGYPGGPPMNHGVMYPDPVSGMHGAAALLTALYYRNRTGQGQYIDLSMQEANIPFIGEAIMEYSMNTRVLERRGNTHPTFAPHSYYRCQGEDEWVSIVVTSDEEWQALVTCMGSPPWTHEKRFATPLSRVEHREALDQSIESWTKELDKREIMYRLQQAGVPSGAVLAGDDLLNDQHLGARNHFQELEYPDGNRYKTLAAAWKMSSTPIQHWRSSPCLGEDNEWVLIELLGMPKEECEKLREKGVIATEPSQDAVSF